MKPMTDQIARLTSLCKAFTNAANFGVLSTLVTPASAIHEYDAIKTTLLRSVEGTMAWERYCNRNGFYHTHTASDFLEGKTPSIRI